MGRGRHRGGSRRSLPCPGLASGGREEPRTPFLSFPPHTSSLGKSVPVSELPALAESWRPRLCCPPCSSACCCCCCCRPREGPIVGSGCRVGEGLGGRLGRRHEGLCPAKEDLGTGAFQHLLLRPQHCEDSGSSQTMALPPLYPALGPAMGVEGSLHLSILHSPNPEPHGHVVHTQVTGAQS